MTSTPQRLLTREAIAAYVATEMSPGELYPRLFTFSAAPVAPHTTEEIERAVYEEVDRLRREPPSEAELERIRNQTEATAVRRLRLNLGVAFQLAESETFWYDWNQVFKDDAARAKVTATDVQRVPTTYFRPSNRTVATLVRPDSVSMGRKN